MSQPSKWDAHAAGSPPSRPHAKSRNVKDCNIFFMGEKKGGEGSKKHKRVVDNKSANQDRARKNEFKKSPKTIAAHSKLRTKNAIFLLKMNLFPTA